MGSEAGLTQIDIPPPYAPMFHYLEDMKGVHDAKEDVPPLENATFRALYRYFTEGAPATEFQNTRQNLAEGVITYSRLWALYKPDTLVFMQTLGHPEVLRIVNTEKKTNIFGEEVGRDITVAQVLWDGRRRRFHQSRRKVRQVPFTVTRRITSLKLVPLEFLEVREKIDLIKKVTDRGKRWATFCRGKPMTMSYQGPAVPYLVNLKAPLV